MSRKMHVYIILTYFLSNSQFNYSDKLVHSYNEPVNGDVTLTEIAGHLMRILESENRTVRIHMTPGNI